MDCTFPQYVACALFFFFFQAEDGIRDYKVTGVQTCALPICSGAEVRPETSTVQVVVRPAGSRHDVSIEQRDEVRGGEGGSGRVGDGDADRAQVACVEIVRDRDAEALSDEVR